MQCVAMQVQCNATRRNAMYCYGVQRNAMRYKYVRVYVRTYARMYVISSANAGSVQRALVAL
eukprot:7253945-Lingulodinium_polyedra.AAC.1